MSRGFGITIRICMTAPFALVNGIAAFRAGRIDYRIFITMTERVYILFINVRTYRTRSPVFSQVYTGRLFYGCPFAVSMSFGFYEMIRISVAAGFTGVPRIALRRSSWFYDFTFVVVSFGFGIISVITVAAARAFIYCITLLRTGRSNDRIPCVIVIDREFIRRRTVGVVRDDECILAFLFNPSSACITFPVQHCIAVTRRPDYAYFMAVVRLYYRCFGHVDTHIHITSIAPVAEPVHRIKNICAVYRRFGKDDA